MKGEQAMRKLVALESGCTEWDGVQQICVQHGRCDCLREARERLADTRHLTLDEQKVMDRALRRSVKKVSVIGTGEMKP